jgi:hypothetical protein
MAKEKAPVEMIDTKHIGKMLKESEKLAKKQEKTAAKSRNYGSAIDNAAALYLNSTIAAAIGEAGDDKGVTKKAFLKVLKQALKSEKEDLRLAKSEENFVEMAATTLTINGLREFIDEVAEDKYTLA